jgi:hypothetical protein
MLKKHYNKMNLKKNILKNISNVPGTILNKKIVVIESDDWGSIRMPSVNVYEVLKNKGLDLDSGDSKRYNVNDTLASAEDLIALFEVLSSFKDSKGNSPIFTAVSLVANPDFERIKNNNYEEYYWEPFTETLKKYQSISSFSAWQEGIKNKLFIPEFHGREHLNVAAWMRSLREGNHETLLSFEHGFWGFTNKHPHDLSFQAAFDLEKKEDLKIQSEIIESGLKLFKDTFGYKARFFVPPNGPFNNSLEKVAAQNGIEYMSASKIQLEVLGEGKFQKKYHWLGQKNESGQHYITRNCFFEPSQEGKDWVTSCLSDIEVAFRWKKPAVISSHRVNYIGRLRPENRIKGLKSLELLLKSILVKWPDVEFKTSVELGDLITKKTKE